MSTKNEKFTIAVLSLVVAIFSVSSLISGACSADPSCSPGSQVKKNTQYAAGAINAFSALLGFLLMCVKIFNDFSDQKPETSLFQKSFNSWSFLASGLTVTWLNSLSSAVTSFCGATNSCGTQIFPPIFSGLAFLGGFVICIAGVVTEKMKEREAQNQRAQAPIWSGVPGKNPPDQEKGNFKVTVAELKVPFNENSSLVCVKINWEFHNLGAAQNKEAVAFAQIGNDDRVKVASFKLTEPNAHCFVLNCRWDQDNLIIFCEEPK